MDDLRCGRCDAVDTRSGRCRLKASCKIGCVKRCWIHAAQHIRNKVCSDYAPEYAPFLEAGEKAFQIQQNTQNEELEKVLMDLQTLRQRLEDLDYRRNEELRLLETLVE